jgi:hypothetical protein
MRLFVVALVLDGEGLAVPQVITNVKPRGYGYAIQNSLSQYEMVFNAFNSDMDPTLGKLILSTVLHRLKVIVTYSIP